MKSVRKFHPGDNVLVYDTQTKISSKGKVKNCKSKNSYIVVINECDKHISGDHMSILPKDSDNNSNSIITNDTNTNTVISDNDNNYDENDSDNISVVSDNDIEIFVPSDLVYDTQFNNIPRRRYRSEAQKLNDSLTSNPPGSRLRPRR